MLNLIEIQRFRQNFKKIQNGGQNGGQSNGGRGIRKQVHLSPKKRGKQNFDSTVYGSVRSVQLGQLMIFFFFFEKFFFARPPHLVSTN